MGGPGEACITINVQGDYDKLISEQTPLMLPWKEFGGKAPSTGAHSPIPSLPATHSSQSKES